MSDTDFTGPVGQCSLAALASLQSYGLDSATIIELCLPPDGSTGCLGAQDCLNAYLLAQTADAKAIASDVSIGLDVAFMLYNGYMVFMMQLGKIRTASA